ncbi:MAG: hypothetical protein V8Q30_04980 [Acutalibacteraceae bacterium]
MLYFLSEAFIIHPKRRNTIYAAEFVQALSESRWPCPRDRFRSDPGTDGLFFKDLARTGQLLPYEDWRLPAQTRAEDSLPV